jgi:hypothetical protein
MRVLDGNDRLQVDPQLGFGATGSNDYPAPVLEKVTQAFSRWQPF